MKTKFIDMDQIAKLVLDAGFTGEAAAIAVAIIWVESRGNVYAININDMPTSKAYLSMDVGLCQFNTYWHPDFPVSSALDPKKSVERMYALSKGGTRFHFWMAYTGKYYLKYMEFARACINRVQNLTT